MISVINRRLSRLFLDDPGLIGCRRRGAWSFQEDTPWRQVRGNALLQVIGDRWSADTPAGSLGFYTASGIDGDYLLQFRGGPWNLDWVEDFYDLWSLLVMYWGDPAQTIIVLHENKGELDIKEVEVPKTLNARKRSEEIMKQHNATPPGRISKSGSRAVRMCPHCPHKQRCDAEDRLRDQTDDWSPTYPQP